MAAFPASCCCSSCMQGHGVRRERTGRLPAKLPRVTGEDIVPRFDGYVTGKAGLECYGITELTVIELNVTPTSRRRVLRGVLDHELHIRGCACNEGLPLAKRLVVFFRSYIAPGESGDDRSIR